MDVRDVAMLPDIDIQHDSSISVYRKAF
ncbi:hypothetical protein AZE42_11854 [Rhizopogon vesiculosus]|uniref:Uncharacterized protein n=1 Tax=Rhizopogon vesiculosus TaxID=180088 RepID=A0A1J8PYL6_9AGAM|nr:hypothetical protein AZE42_11854 [Rhizopogon vesiculosus]